MAKNSTTPNIESMPDLQELLTGLVKGISSINARLDNLESGYIESSVNTPKAKTPKAKTYKSKYDMIEVLSGTIPERFNENDNTQPIEFTVYHSGVWTWLYTTDKPVLDIRDALKASGLHFSSRRFKKTGIGAYCDKTTLHSTKASIFGKFARYITVHK